MTPAIERERNDAVAIALNRTAAALLWLLPLLFAFSIWSPSLHTWFTGDDFVWLGLQPGVHSWPDLRYALFQPTEHGTWRPLSERAFFLVFRWLFDLDALPYHICIFATQFANLALLSAIVLRMTRSRLAAFCAPVFWMANYNMATVMSWASSYMQVLCGFFILLAFGFLLRYIETGKRRYYGLQWAAFLIGFGAMETAVVYPAIAAVYVFFYARRHLPKILPLFVPSVLFAVLHFRLVPAQTSGPYSMHFGAALPNTLWTYWNWALLPYKMGEVLRISQATTSILIALLTLALLGFSAWRVARKDWLPAVFLCWFAILLAPVLPLRDHISEYYLTLPLIGLVSLGGYATAFAWEARLPWRAATAVLLSVYMLLSVHTSRFAANWWRKTGHKVETVVMGVDAAHELHPGKTILLAGVDDFLFWEALYDRPFMALGISDVYLTPGSEAGIQGLPATRQPEYVLGPALTLQSLEEGKAIVYQADGDRLRNITEQYQDYNAPLLRQATQSTRVDAGNELQARRFGAGWYDRENTFRWMSKHAVVSVPGPSVDGQEVQMTGNCHPMQLDKGPLVVTVAANGARLGSAEIRRCDQPFHFAFPLPSALTGKPSVEVGIEVNRTISVAGDGRELGLMFGSFEVTPRHSTNSEAPSPIAH